MATPTERKHEKNKHYMPYSCQSTPPGRAAVSFLHLAKGSLLFVQSGKILYRNIKAEGEWDEHSDTVLYTLTVPLLSVT